MSEFDAEGTWAGLADDIPAAPRSVLQAFIEATLRDEPLSAVRPLKAKQSVDTEMWLLRRACTAVCLVTAVIHPDLSAASLPRVASEQLEDPRRAAMVEDVVRAMTAYAFGAELGLVPLVRDDPAVLVQGFVDAIVVMARLLEDRLGVPAVVTVGACFGAADGTLQRPA